MMTDTELKKNYIYLLHQPHYFKKVELEGMSKRTKILEVKDFPKNNIIYQKIGHESPFLKEKIEELEKVKLELEPCKVHISKMFELISIISILKNDYIPKEIIPHVFIGTIGSATNLKQLEEFKITHIRYMLPCRGKKFFS